VELHSLHIELAMPQPHDQIFLIAGGDLQAIRQAGFLNNQRMITTGGERLGQVGIQAVALVRNLGRFSMHRLRRPYYVAAKYFTDNLVAEADAEDWQFAGEFTHDFFAEAGIIWRAGAGRNDNRVIVGGGNFGQADPVVAYDLQRMAQIGDRLIHIVSEGIIVIDKQNHDSVPSQYLKQYFGLVADFLIFGFRDRIGDNTGPGLDRHFVAGNAEGADRNAGVHIAAKIEVADCAGVGSAALRFQFVDDFHCSDFRRAADGAGGEAGFQRIDRRIIRVQFAADFRYDMHYMGKVLDLHHFGDLDCARQADPTDVVAAQIDQHGVFGAFLTVGEQFGRQPGVLGGVFAARAGAGDRAGEHFAVLQLDQHFRRGPDQLALTEIDIEHIR